MNDKQNDKKTKSIKLYLVAIVISIILILLAFYCINNKSERLSDGGYSFHNIEPLSPTKVKIVFGNGLTDISILEPEDILLKLTSDSQQVDITFSLSTNPIKIIANAVDLNINVSLIDYYPAGLELNSGDYLEIDGLNPGNEYQIELIWLVTNDSIPLIGQDSFIMPLSV